MKHAYHSKHECFMTREIPILQTTHHSNKVYFWKMKSSDGLHWVVLQSNFKIVHLEQPQIWTRDHHHLKSQVEYKVHLTICCHMAVTKVLWSQELGNSFSAILVVILHHFSPWYLFFFCLCYVYYFFLLLHCLFGFNYFGSVFCCSNLITMMNILSTLQDSQSPGWQI